MAHAKGVLAAQESRKGRKVSKLGPLSWVLTDLKLT